MTTTNFTSTLLVDQSPKEVFDAVNTPQDWWSGDFEGHTKKLNDEFTYRYKDIHYSKQRVVEMIPNEKVVWLVIESQLNFVDDKDEWTGTKIVFEISKKGDKTQLQFTHVGLQPEVECYGGCSLAWSQLVQENLCSLITTGESQKISLG
jgi:hypothetical protein